MRDSPLLGQFALGGPLAFLAVATLEPGVGLLPSLRVGPLGAFRRRARSIQDQLAEAFQAPPVAEVDQLVLVGSEHQSLNFLRFPVFRCGR